MSGYGPDRDQGPENRRTAPLREITGVQVRLSITATGIEDRVGRSLGSVL